MEIAELVENVKKMLSERMANLIIQASGETVLRYALGNILIGAKMGEIKDQSTYQALMAATDAGYQCGVKVYDEGGDNYTLMAVFLLPTGPVEIEIPNFGEFYEPTTEEQDMEHIARFIGVEE